MPEPTDVKPHQVAHFDQNFADINTELDRLANNFRSVRAESPDPRALDIAGLAGWLAEGNAPGLADLLAAAIVRLAEVGLVAPAAEPTEAQRRAERIILSHTEDIEFGTIGEMLDDEYERLGDEEGDRLREQVDKLIGTATVTVSWPEPPEGGA